MRASAGRRAGAPAAIAITIALALAGCSSPAHRTAPVDAWAPDAGCPSPSSVASIVRLPALEFAHAAGQETAIASTGCTYQTAAGGTQIAIATQPGSPGSVVYNTAAGVENTPEPALGQGAHLGTSSFFCAIAVPATKGRALTVSILPPGGGKVDCAPLIRLVKDVATRTG
jgi:hypothetical protein